MILNFWTKFSLKEYFQSNAEKSKHDKNDKNEKNDKNGLEKSCLA